MSRGGVDCQNKSKLLEMSLGKGQTRNEPETAIDQLAEHLTP